MHDYGAHVVFICLFMHIGQGLDYGSYAHNSTSNIGSILLFTVIGTAFLRINVTPDQQHTVRTQVFLRANSHYQHPFSCLACWHKSTRTALGRLCSRQGCPHLNLGLHFILPFIILGIVTFLLFLHETRSNNPTGITLNSDEIPSTIMSLFSLWAH